MPKEMNPNKDKIIEEIEAVNDMTDQRTVQDLYNRLMLYNTWNGANAEIFAKAKEKGIIP